MGLHIQFTAKATSIIVFYILASLVVENLAEETSGGRILAFI